MSDDAEIHYRITFKRKKVDHQKLEGKIVDRLIGFTLIKDDLQQIITWLSILSETTENIDDEQDKSYSLARSLFVSSIFFTGNVSGKQKEETR